MNNISIIEKTASPLLLGKLEKAVSVMKYLPNEQQISALMNILQQIDRQSTTNCFVHSERKNKIRYQQISDMIRKVFYQEKSLEYTYISDAFHQPVITITRDLTTRSWHASFLLSHGNNINFRGPFLIGSDIEEVEFYTTTGPAIKDKEGKNIPIQNQQDSFYLAFDPSIETHLVENT